MKMHALVDLDSFFYRAAYNSGGSFEVAQNLTTEYVFQTLLDLEVHSSTLVFSCSRKLNFRRLLVAGYYKENRTASPHADIITDLKYYMHESHGAIFEENLEADDVISILATDPKGLTNNIIVSADKDFMSIPCQLSLIRLTPAYHYKHAKPTPEQAFKFFMTQVLTGDSSDGYKGCKKIGPKTAEKLLQNTNDRKKLWEIVVDQYLKAGMTVENAIENARLAYLLRSGDYNFITKDIRLWSPETHL